MSNSVIVAGIDCGTNSIRLKIARVDEQGMTDIVPKVLRVVRLGESVDATGRFADSALARVHAAAEEFAQILEEHNVQALRFVATSATRDAKNRVVFEDDMEHLLGVRPEVISGLEEARLSYMGAISAFARSQIQYPALIMDLGGGSTELVLGGDGVHTAVDQVQASYSMNIGSVRMTERHDLYDQPDDANVEAAIVDIDEHLDVACAHIPIEQTRTFVGVSGTVTTMAALALNLPEYDASRVNGIRLPFAQVEQVDTKFLHMSREQRRAYKAIHPGRVDVVGGGALVLNRVIARVQERVVASSGELNELLISEHGLLDGIVLDLGRRMLRRV